MNKENRTITLPPISTISATSTGFVIKNNTDKPITIVQHPDNIFVNYRWGKQMDKPKRTVSNMTCSSCGKTFFEWELHWADGDIYTCKECRSLKKKKGTMENFRIKQCDKSERPTLEGNGFDGLEIGGSRGEAEDFISYVNGLINLYNDITDQLKSWSEEKV